MPGPILSVSGALPHSVTSTPMASGFFHAFHTRFDASALRNAFAPRKPRNALLRVLLGLVGVALLVVLLAVGLVVGTLMLTFTMLRRLAGGSRQAGAKDRNVVDAEYRVVRKNGQPLLR
jgi:hypothetical protein